MLHSHFRTPFKLLCVMPVSTHRSIAMPDLPAFNVAEYIFSYSGKGSRKFCFQGRHIRPLKRKTCL